MVRDSCNSKDIWKWILEQKDHEELLEFAKKTNVKVPGFREEAIRNIQKPLLFKACLSKSAKFADHENLFELPSLEAILAMSKEDLVVLASNSPHEFSLILSKLLASKTKENCMFAQELFSEAIEDSTKTKTDIEENADKKKIRELEQECCTYKLREAELNEDITKKAKIHEKQIEKLNVVLKKRETEIGKLNYKIKKLQQENEKMHVIEREIEKSRLIIEENKIEIEKLNEMMLEKESKLVSFLEDKEDIVETETEEATDSRVIQKSPRIGIWGIPDVEDFEQNGAPKINVFLDTADNEESILEKLSGLNELWYIEPEVSAFVVRRVRKIIKKLGLSVELKKILSIQEIKMFLKKGR